MKGKRQTKDKWKYIVIKPFRRMEILSPWSSFSLNRFVVWWNKPNTKFSYLTMHITVILVTAISLYENLMWVEILATSNSFIPKLAFFKLLMLQLSSLVNLLYLARIIVTSIVYIDSALSTPCCIDLIF